MRSLSFLFLLVSFSVFGQLEFNYEFVLKSLEKKNKELYQNIWDKVVQGEVSVYWNDSFTKALEVEDIFESFTVYEKKKGKIISRPFDPTRDFTGFTLVYSENSIKPFSKTYDIIGLGPNWEQMLPFGVQLGERPMFILPIDSLVKSLNDDEMEYYNALLDSYASIGDFRGNLLMNDDYIEVLDITSHLFSRRTYNDNITYHPTSLYDTSVAYYYSQLFTVAASKATDSGIVFYEDSMLSIPIKNFDPNFSRVDEVTIPDNSSGDDDAFQTHIVKDKFSFDYCRTDLLVQDEIVLIFVINPETKYSKRIYISYDKLNPFLQPLDRIVLEALLKEISK